MNIDLSNHISAAVRERAEKFAEVDLLKSGSDFAMTLWAETDRDDVDASYAAFEFCRHAEEKVRREASEACRNIRWHSVSEFDNAVRKARVLVEQADLWERTRDVFRKLVQKAQDDVISANFQHLLDNELRGDDTYYRFTLCREYESTRRNWHTGEDEPYTYRSNLVRGKDYRGKSELEFERSGRRQEVTWAKIGTALKNAHKLVDDAYGCSEVEVVIDSGKLWRIDSELPEKERHERNVKSLMGRRVLGTIRRLK